MSSLQNQKTVSGNMIQLKAKGVVIGRAQNLDPRVSYGTKGFMRLALLCHKSISIYVTRAYSP